MTDKKKVPENQEKELSAEALEELSNNKGGAMNNGIHK